MGDYRHDGRKGRQGNAKFNQKCMGKTLMTALAKHHNGQLFIYTGQDKTHYKLIGEFGCPARIPRDSISLTSLKDSNTAMQARAAIAELIHQGMYFKNGAWHQAHPKPITLTEFEDK